MDKSTLSKAMPTTCILYQIMALISFAPIHHMLISLNIVMTLMAICCAVKNFLVQMRSVAAECYRVLKKGKFCAILMGDTRKKGHVVPMSFDVMKIFEDIGFKLKEIIIKEQHNCKATGFWKTNSIKYNFLLLAHEYLFIFRK